MDGAHRILICGLNGAGKSTLGRALAGAVGYEFRDIEDYWFPKIDPDNPYRTQRTEAEVSALLADDLQRHPRMILAAVRANYSPDVQRLLTRAIYVAVPREIRLRRVRERSFRRFGSRALPGGDLHEQEETFFAMIAARSESHVTDWLEKSGLPVIPVDGTLMIDENVRKLKELLQQ